MKQFIFICMFLSVLMTTVKAQTGRAAVGINTEQPHNRALLDVKNNTDKTDASKYTSMGVLLPSVDIYTDLPLYDVNESDSFRDDATMTGMIMYVREGKKYYQYDGETWIPVAGIGHIRNTNVSLFKLSSNKAITPLDIFTGDRILDFDVHNTGGCVDNLGIYNSNNRNYQIIRQDGIYRLYVLCGFGGGGANIGTTRFIVTLKYEPAGASNDFIPLFSETGEVVNILGVSASTNINVATSFTRFFKAGDKIQSTFFVSDPGLSGFSLSSDLHRTFLLVEKIR